VVRIVTQITSPCVFCKVFQKAIFFPRLEVFS
jgi:hypothetical protein